MRVKVISLPFSQPFSEPFHPRPTQFFLAPSLKTAKGSATSKMQSWNNTTYARVGEGMGMGMGVRDDETVEWGGVGSLLLVPLLICAYANASLPPHIHTANPPSPPHTHTRPPPFSPDRHPPGPNPGRSRAALRDRLHPHAARPPEQDQPAAQGAAEGEPGPKCVAVVARGGVRRGGCHFGSETCGR